MASFQDILNEWVAEDVASDPHDYYLPYIIATAYIVKTVQRLDELLRYHVTKILHSPSKVQLKYGLFCQVYDVFFFVTF